MFLFFINIFSNIPSLTDVFSRTTPISKKIWFTVRIIWENWSSEFLLKKLKEREKERKVKKVKKDMMNDSWNPKVRNVRNQPPERKNKQNNIKEGKIEHDRPFRNGGEWPRPCHRRQTKETTLILLFSVKCSAFRGTPIFASKSLSSFVF